MAPSPPRQEHPLSPYLILILALLCLTPFLTAQENPEGQEGSESQDAAKRNSSITELDNGRYSIMEYSGDSALIFRGSLSSLDPEIRDGKFYFFDSTGRVAAIGMYRNDIPIGPWTYYDTLMQPLEVFDYNSVLQNIRKDADVSVIDPGVLERLPSRFHKYVGDDGAMQYIDELPTFNGGDFESAFSNYFYRQMHLPAYAESLKLEGSVQLGFIIDHEGRVRKPEIMSNSLTDFNMEAMRVLVGSEGWEPASLKGHSVSAFIAMRFVFDNPDIDGRYYVVEEMPLFNGQSPINSFRYFIGQNLRYPIEAGRAGIEGRVIVQFTVMRDGSVDEIKVIRGTHPALDREAVRVISLSPKWTPGKDKGKTVKVVFTFPVNFRLR